MSIKTGYNLPGETFQLSGVKAPSNNMRTLKDMRVTGVTSKEIPNQRKTIRGIPMPRGNTPKPAPTSNRKGSIMFGTNNRYYGSNLPEETIIIKKK